MRQILFATALVVALMSTAYAKPNPLITAKNAAINKVLKGCDKKILPGFCKAGRVYVAYKAGQKAYNVAEIAMKAREAKAALARKRVKKLKKMAKTVYKYSPQSRGIKAVGYAGKLLKKVKQGYDNAKKRN